MESEAHSEVEPGETSGDHVCCHLRQLSATRNDVVPTSTATRTTLTTQAQHNLSGIDAGYDTPTYCYPRGSSVWTAMAAQTRTMPGVKSRRSRSTVQVHKMPRTFFGRDPIQSKALKRYEGSETATRKMHEGTYAVTGLYCNRRFCEDLWIERVVGSIHGDTVPERSERRRNGGNPDRRICYLQERM